MAEAVAAWEAAKDKAGTTWKAAKDDAGTETLEKNRGSHR